MTDKVKRMYELVRSDEYKKERIRNEGYDMTQVFLDSSELYEMRSFLDMIERETPFLLDGDIYGFNRRNVYCPHYFENGKKRGDGIGNITPNYARVIDGGFDEVLCDIEKYEKINTDEKSVMFYGVLKQMIAAVLDICDRYKR